MQETIMNIQTKNLSIELDSDDWNWIFYEGAFDPKLEDRVEGDRQVYVDIHPHEPRVYITQHISLVHVLSVTAVHISHDGLLITSQSLGLKNNKCDTSRLAPMLKDANEVYVTCADDTRLLDNTNNGVIIANRGRVRHFDFVIKPTE